MGWGEGMGQVGHLPLGPGPFCIGVWGPIVTMAGRMGGPITVLPWGPVCNCSATGQTHNQAIDPSPTGGGGGCLSIVRPQSRVQTN